MRSRRAGREAALQALYQCDTLGDFSRGAVDLFFGSFYSSSSLLPPGENSEGIDGQSETAEPLTLSCSGNREFSEILIWGVIEQMSFIDVQLNMASTHWSVTRMSRVDCNILRIGAYELGFCEGVPTKVVLNEAIEIAKRFGFDESQFL